LLRVKREDIETYMLESEIDRKQAEKKGELINVLA